MKKRLLLSTACFAAAFAFCYLALCYLVPGLRIKLAAPPILYFLESVRHGVLLKSILSAAVGLLAGSVCMAASGKPEKP